MLKNLLVDEGPFPPINLPWWSESELLRGARTGLVRLDLLIGRRSEPMTDVNDLLGFLTSVVFLSKEQRLIESFHDFNR